MDAGVPVFLIFAFIAGAFFWTKVGEKLKRKFENFRDGVLDDD